MVNLPVEAIGPGDVLHSVVQKFLGVATLLSISGHH